MNELGAKRFCALLLTPDVVDVCAERFEQGPAGMVEETELVWKVVSPVALGDVQHRAERRPVQLRSQVALFVLWQLLRQPVGRFEKSLTQLIELQLLKSRPLHPCPLFPFAFPHRLLPTSPLP
jgi:hypothetical protein